ncbi:MAG: CcmD family protein [Candidatus Latescibacteria bacterium]|nr:CcmD family protein [Candidatus Latescibacterota bacterium]NIM22394.1 CcmD family protein [Candidatus Latescibacterota bacterium]NIM64754.1 CcmD family protein [Candidatus Latescibacterota bacterium]NIO01265.1 CcmD family protein [Candidatus Latescibacterota bacterium]NIO27757.1 CcmD family protein [Candidatus Latescibacterota bacterium]
MGVLYKHLFWAYAIIWTAIFLYLLNIDLKQRAIMKEIAALKKKLLG